ncbi:oligosaccharide flippase family protein [Candidatus Peregrinibacteria bacterium]|nr:oligosaccharide flippase family protein [Candidatus Peregrinibacteria bacterium]
MKKFYTTSLTSYFLRSLTVIIGIISTILLARLLGPAHLGVYAFCLSFVQILAIISKVGFGSVVTRDVSVYIKKGCYDFIRGLWRFSVLIVLGISFGLFVVAFLGGLFFDSGLESGNLYSFWYALFLLPIFALIELVASFLRGSGHVLAAQLPFFIVRPFVFIILLILIYVLGNHIPIHSKIAVLAQVGAAMVALIFVLAIKKITLSRLSISGRARYEVSRWLRSGITLMFLDGTHALWHRMDLIMLTGLASISSTGVYRVAMQFSSVIIFGLVSINAIIAPQIANLYDTDHEELQKLLIKASCFIAALSLPTAFFLIGFGERLIVILVGPEFQSAYAATVILCLGQLVSALIGSVGLILNMTHNENITFKVTFICLLANVSLNAFLIPLYRDVGAAISSAVCMIAWNIILMIFVKKRTGLYTTIANPHYLKAVILKIG